MCQHHTARGSKYERKYELLACVSIKQGCMRTDEYRKYELVSCVRIIQC